ncbi:MAG: hypothetical protein VB858_19525 [Planctomycetaceae bacterium]
MPETPETNKQPDILIQNLQKPACMFALGALAVGLLWFSTSSSGPVTIHDVSIDYTYDLGSGRTSRSTMDVESIQIQSGFVLIRRDNGGGNLLAVDRLHGFTFKPAGQ